MNGNTSYPVGRALIAKSSESQCVYSLDREVTLGSYQKRTKEIPQDCLCLVDNLGIQQTEPTLGGEPESVTKSTASVSPVAVSRLQWEVWGA